jgi:hypothetical protein
MSSRNILLGSDLNENNNRQVSVPVGFPSHELPAFPGLQI